MGWAGLWAGLASRWLAASFVVSWLPAGCWRLEWDWGRGGGRSGRGRGVGRRRHDVERMGGPVD